MNEYTRCPVCGDSVSINAGVRHAAAVAASIAVEKSREVAA